MRPIFAFILAISAASCLAQDDLGWPEPQTLPQPLRNAEPLKQTPRWEGDDEFVDAKPAGTRSWFHDMTQTGFDEQQPESSGIQQTAWQQPVPPRSGSVATSNPNVGGWLGRRFFRMDLSFWKYADYDDVDTTLASFDLNIPLPWNDRWVPSVSHDLFFVIDAGHENVELGPAPGTLGFTENIRNDIFGLSLGTTLYATMIPRLRPFVQLGYRYEQMDLKLTIEDHDGMVIDERELADAEQHRFLLNPGAELDLWRSVVLRGQVNVNTEDSENTEWHTQLIFLPGEKWMLNIGAFGLTNGDFTGIRFGGGFRF